MNYIGDFEEALKKFPPGSGQKTRALVEDQRAEIKAAAAVGHASPLDLLEISRGHVRALFEHVIAMEVASVARRNDPDWSPCKSSKQCTDYASACRNQGIEECAKLLEEKDEGAAKAIRALKWEIRP